MKFIRFSALKTGILATGAVVFAAVVAFVLNGHRYGEKLRNNEGYSPVQQVIWSFYYEKDVGENPQPMSNNSFIDEDIMHYLSEKIEVDRLVRKKNKNVIVKDSYNAEVILHDTKKNGKYCLQRYQVITTYNYERLGEELTTVSEEVYVLFDAVNERIVDFYVLSDYYDIAVRERPEWVHSFEIMGGKPFVLTDEIVSKGREFREKFE